MTFAVFQRLGSFPLLGLDTAWNSTYTTAKTDSTENEKGKTVRRWLGGEGASPSEQASPTGRCADYLYFSCEYDSFLTVCVNHAGLLLVRRFAGQSSVLDSPRASLARSTQCHHACLGWLLVSQISWWLGMHINGVVMKLEHVVSMIICAVMSFFFLVRILLVEIELSTGWFLNMEEQIACCEREWAHKSVPMLCWRRLCGPG